MLTDIWCPVLLVGHCELQRRKIGWDGHGLRNWSRCLQGLGTSFRQIAIEHFCGLSNTALGSTERVFN
jgi:hypothetical protein